MIYIVGMFGHNVHICFMFWGLFQPSVSYAFGSFAHFGQFLMYTV